MVGQVDPVRSIVICSDKFFTAFLFSGIAVTFVVLFTQSFRMLSFVIDNSGSALVFFQLMGLMIPTFLPLIIPISVGIGVLFIYHKFCCGQRACDYARRRGSQSDAYCRASPCPCRCGRSYRACPDPLDDASCKSYVCYAQYQVRDEYSAIMIRPGAFNDLAEGLTFFARRKGGNGGMEDILVHDVRTPSRPVTIMARNGIFLVENNIPQVVVFNGRRQEVDVQTGRLQELNFDRYVLDLHL